ncbi:MULTISPECIES: glycosyltransferase [Pseudoalteromonas]|uniref:glycosyltransferase n=1 Tax=Pseudoalteromonas TaxID=53246 RepID=UPI000F7A3338|nr:MULTISPECIES: glycosyltransferase [Pseudoalteromonas]MCG7563692.1 glycosyltransferase [Pseudoalteromonas sp. McH1-42]MEC4090311.1 glycosyltransferase [Pseudoalteromonas rubra]
MNICIIGKVSPIQGGVAQLNFWLCYALAKQGHQVHLISNGTETEEEFRITLGRIPDDMSGTPFADVKNNLHIHYTNEKAKYQYIPYANPFVSKLSNIAIDVVRKYECDFILGHYFEPYGVAAYVTSQATGVPFGLKHAGSDVGRLLKNPEHNTLYHEMFSKAGFIFSSGSTTRRFYHAGVDPYNVMPFAPPTCPEFIYNPERKALDLEQYLISTKDALSKPIYSMLREQFGYENYDSEASSIGIYGKVGISKGSYDLIESLGKLKKRGKKFNFLALTNGHAHQLKEFVNKVKEAGIEENTIWLPFMPHWQVPEFINLCDAVCFLERDFAIPIHMPGVAVEVMRCGKCLIVSDEIYEKQRVKDKLEPGENLLVVDPQDTDALAEKISFVLDFPDKAKQIGANCYEVAKDFYPSFDEIAESISDKFTEAFENIKRRELEMSALELQSFVNRLYTDDVFRKLNDVAPDVTEALYQLTDEEKQAIRNIEKKALEQYASSLKMKNFKRNTASYEYTLKVLGEPALFKLFDRFYNVNPAYPGESKLAFVSKFGQFLEDSINGSQDDIPNYTAELIRFENIRNQLNLTTTNQDDFEYINTKNASTTIENDTKIKLVDSATLLKLDYDLAQLIELLDEDEIPANVEEKETAMVMYFVPTSPKAKLLSLNPAAGSLISMIKGELTFAQLLDHFETQTGISGCSEDLKQALEFFHSNELLLISQ